MDVQRARELTPKAATVAVALCTYNTERQTEVHYEQTEGSKAL